MKVAVTGATGFLGSHVVEVLAPAHEVVGVVRDPGRARRVLGWGATEVRVADLGDREALRAAFRGTEAVVLVAALAVRDDPPWEAWVRANVDGVRHAVEAAAGAGVRRIVLVSTVAVHRLLHPFATVGLDAPLLDEVRVPLTLHQLTTRRRYSLSKAMGEGVARRRARELGVELAVIRPGPIYGSRDPKLTRRYVELLERRVVALPTARVPHVHAADVALAISGALRPSTPPGAWFVTGPAVSPARIVRTLTDLVGRGPRVIPIPVPLRLAYDDGPAARDLSFRPRALREGLAEVIRAERGTPIP